MYKWILNRKRFRPLLFVFNIIVYSVNMALIYISIYMFFCIQTGIHTDWFAKAMASVSETDLFFSNQSDIIFKAMTITFFCVCIFAVIIMLGYRYMQLQEEKKEVGIFLVCGYQKQRMILPLFAEVFCDIIISIPFARLIAVYMQYFIQSDAVFLQIQRERGYVQTDSIVILLLLVFLSGGIMLIQTIIYVNRLKKTHLDNVLEGVQIE